MSNKITIFDLDNCLAHDEWRMPLIDWTQDDVDKRYAAYHMRCGDDKPGNLDIFTMLLRGSSPVFITSRPESVRSTTSNWIRQHLGIWTPSLIMRERGNKTPTLEFKMTHAARLKIQRRIVAAFDDREDIVRGYRELGINGARLWLHDTCAMTHPTLNERITV